MPVGTGLGADPPGTHLPSRGGAGASVAPPAECPIGTAGACQAGSCHTGACMQTQYEWQCRYTVAAMIVYVSTTTRDVASITYAVYSGTGVISWHYCPDFSVLCTCSMSQVGNWYQQWAAQFSSACVHTTTAHDTEAGP